MVRGDVAEDGRERSYPKRIVVRNRDVVLRRLLASQPDMAARLPGDAVAESCQRLYRLAPETSRGSFMQR